ncbi:MAG: RHS repeat protein [Pyrinomonadaceae bacterium]|nr:RHS repeat protein [Pyrinomonadaceae bacterium]
MLRLSLLEYFFFRNITENSGAYTRYEYPSNGVQSKVYSTIVDTNNNGADAADEVLSESWSDGAGRVLRSRTEHPGSAGGFAASLAEYDVLGRLKRSSVPTEVDANWNPAGDDYRGVDTNNNLVWLWTSQEYDWKGRVTREINTDGTDRLTTYEGCGCAGGVVATLQSELVPRDDQPNTLARRTQKVYQDILGRTYKTEFLDWNGNVYKTLLNSFSGRDEVMIERVVAGVESNSVFRETTQVFDGLGRLISRHIPEQDANTATVFTYFPDDKPQTITDARGATKHYSYNNLGLLQQIGWTVPPGSGIELPEPVSFTYDALGNRTSMIDGAGTVEYQYNQLSQLTSETREFNETVPLSPTGDNRFRIEYNYGLSGILIGYKEPFGEVITYSFDRSGKIYSVDGLRTLENVQKRYVTGTEFRAWGAIKTLNYENGSFLAVGYNARMLPQEYEFRGVNGNYFTKLSYDYLSDGKLRFSDTDYNIGVNDNAENFDRSYSYDYLGRLTSGRSGAEARGQNENNTGNRPFRMTLEYNHFGEITRQIRLHYGMNTSAEFDYANGRTITDVRTQDLQYWDNVSKVTSHTYDADGRSTVDGQQYDAEGRLKYKHLEHHSTNLTHYRTFQSDGDGNILRSSERKISWCNSPPANRCFDFEKETYRIISSVLQTSLNEIVIKRQHIGNPSEQRSRSSSIYAANTEIAKRTIGNIGTSYQADVTIIKSTDPSGVEHSWFDEINFSFSTVDPFGASLGYENPYPVDPPDTPGYPNCDYDFDHDDRDDCEYPPEFEDPQSEGSGAGSIPKTVCYQDGFEVDCMVALRNIDPDTPVTKENEFPDQAPSTTGPKNVWQDDDSTDDKSNQKEAELDFEQQYSGLDVSFGESAGVRVFVNTAMQLGTVRDHVSQILPGHTHHLSQGRLNQGPEAQSDEATINIALDNCIESLFGGLIMNNWLYSYNRNSKNGYIKFTPTLPGGNGIPGIGEISATTWFTQTGAAIAALQNAESGTTFVAQSGYTSPRSTDVNWIAKEVAENSAKYKDVGFRALFIHEMGNMIANIIRRNGWSNDHGVDNSKFFGVNDPDIGQKLENCVFGGRVGLQSGRLGLSREF